MIVTVAGFKGGVGKTTTAVHLACYFAQASEKVLLVDGDPNRSATGWSKRGSLPFKVCDLLAASKASRGKEHIVIDTEAHPDNEEMEALAEGCDLLVLPSTPDALAIEALLQTVDGLHSLKSYGVLITMVDSRKKGRAEQAKNTLEALEIPVFKQTIRRLTCYESAALDGVPVYAVTGDRFARIAWREYHAFGQEVEHRV